MRFSDGLFCQCFLFFSAFVFVVKWNLPRRFLYRRRLDGWIWLPYFTSMWCVICFWLDLIEILFCFFNLPCICPRALVSKGQFENLLYPSDTVLVISRWVDRFYMWSRGGGGVGVTIIKEKMGSDGVCYVLLIMWNFWLCINCMLYLFSGPQTIFFWAPAFKWVRFACILLYKCYIKFRLKCTWFLFY